jgi:hypothetical protein
MAFFDAVSFQDAKGSKAWELGTMATSRANAVRIILFIIISPHLLGTF